MRTTELNRAFHSTQGVLATVNAFRGPEGQAPFGPVAGAPAGSGPADQLAAFLGRRV